MKRKRKPISRLHGCYGNQNTKCQYIHVFSIVIAVLLSIAALIVSTNLFVSTRETSLDNKHRDVGLNNICQDCLDNVYQQFYIKKDFWMPDSNINRTFPCCGLKSRDLKTMSKMMFSRRRNDFQRTLLYGSITPVSAHKYLLSSDKAMNFSNVDHVTVQLDTTARENNSNNHARGVNIKNDGIEILYSGLYYVYSSLFYEPKTNVSSEHFPYQTWFHYVYRTRPNSPAMSSVILRTVFTCCPKCVNRKDSIYTSGIFYLLAGDLIQVCLSGQGIMGKDTLKDSSFIGVYLLSRG